MKTIISSPVMTLSTNKPLSLILATLLIAPLVAANNLQIAGVYYDPSQAESGGEAIQLENNGTTPIELSTYTLATKQTEFSLPAVTLLPGSGYLITDTGWESLKDDLTWPKTDLELSLSLANTDGFVEIRTQNGIVVDSLAWNASFKAREGEVLTHYGPAVPSFRNSKSEVHTLEATVTVLDGAPVITNLVVTDDAPTEDGIQLLSYNRTIVITATIVDPNNSTVSALVTFLGKEYEMNSNGSTYSATVPMVSVSPGEYTMSIRASDGILDTLQEQTITVLSSTSIKVTGPLEFAGRPGNNATAHFSVTNAGNTAKTVSVQHTIPQASCSPLAVSLQAGEEKQVLCNVTIPVGAAGTRTYTVRVIAS